jgi:predicted DNA-binding transcriptional regulator YafY
MPNTKSSDIRYKVLDRCLRRGGYSTEDLKNEVNKELEEAGYEPVTALNTIRQDLLHIESNYHNVHIESKKVGRNVTYAYETPDSSIYKLQLSDEELAQLSQCMAMLAQFEGLPQMKWLQSFIERFKLSINIEANGKRVVGFDECPYLKGKELFATLLTAICEKRVLKICYKNFRVGVIKELIFHPYYIKEFNKRWFLLGITEGFDSPTNLAFDRIEKVDYLQTPAYRENTAFDFNDDYFEDIVGVTRYEAPVEKIQIRVNNDALPYITTKPLHGSQRIITSGEDYTLIQLEVIPNYELEQLLLYYGESVTVVSPMNFKEKMRERIKRMGSNYELVHID